MALTNGKVQRNSNGIRNLKVFQEASEVFTKTFCRKW